MVAGGGAYEMKTMPVMVQMLRLETMLQMPAMVELGRVAVLLRWWWRSRLAQS